MGKGLKKTYLLLVLVMFVLAGTILTDSREVKAAQNDQTIGILTVRDGKNVMEIPLVFNKEYGVVYPEDSNLYIEKGNEKKTLELGMRKVESSGDAELLSCDWAGKLVLGNDSISHDITIQYRYINGRYTYTSTRTTYMWINPVIVDMSLTDLVLGVGSKGFHPSAGNYLTIRTGTAYKGSIDLDTPVKARFRILDKNGKYVYQKTITDVGGKDEIWGKLLTSWERKTVAVKWNGKASKANNAGLKAGSYVPDGQYTAEVYFYVNNKNFTKSVTKKKKFTVSRKAPSGKDGLNSAKKIPVYTGIANVDYMAEQMIKQAGVKSNMSQDEKVRRIYHWMTVKFTHKHDDEFVKAPKYYDLTSAKAQKAIRDYQNKTNAAYKKGKLTFETGYMESYIEPYMQKRGGTCTEQAYIFKYLCRHVGIEAGTCSGYYKNLNGSKAVHSWSYAVVNGRKYYYDVDIEIQNYRKGQGDYYWYKKTLAEAKKNHIFD